MNAFLTPAYVLVFVGVLTFWVMVLFNKWPDITSWQKFLDCFESKGGQLMLLWVTDLIVLTVLVHEWHSWDNTLQTSVIGIPSGINGAFLGAVGAKPTSNGGGNTPLPTQLKIDQVSGKH